MGYTHYWTQPKDYAPEEWQQICDDVAAILKDVEHVQGIPLAYERDQPGKAPEIGETIRFNGLGEDGHETFYITRKRELEDWQGPERLGWAFCKTARKPYDLAVTACLAYLAALDPPWDVSSDGHGHDWLEGVELARRAVPRLANQIDIPMPIMKGDRWDWRKRIGYVQAKHYDVQTCLDGATYVFDVRDESRCYRFPTYEEARAYLAQFKEKPIKVAAWGGRIVTEGGSLLFNATGCFDGKRQAALDRAQTRILKGLIDRAPAVGRNQSPPAYARPNRMAAPAEEQGSLEELFALCE